MGDISPIISNDILFRYMFITDFMPVNNYRQRDGTIYRYSMNGEVRVVVVDSRLIAPQGVTVDVAAQRLFWVDSYRDVVEMSDYEGHGRCVIGFLSLIRIIILE